MTTLTTPACSAVVARLFAEADASDVALHAQRDALSPQELARLMGGTEDYQSLYGRLRDFHLAVSRETATLLYMLARSKGLYPKILSLLEPRLRPGALVVADNADWSAQYLTRVRDPAGGYMSVPFATDVEVSLKL